MCKRSRAFALNLPLASQSHINLSKGVHNYFSYGFFGWWTCHCWLSNHSISLKKPICSGMALVS